jgi:hypothetical protein
VTKKYQKTKKFGALEIKLLEKRSLYWCLVDHKIQKKIANYQISIMGWPAGYLCKSCKSEWEKIWKRESPVDYV